MSTLKCMNILKKIILNGENKVENDTNTPVLISINNSGVIKISTKKEIRYNHLLEKRHSDWILLWYTVSENNQCDFFQNKMCDLLTKERKAPIVFVDRENEDLANLNLIEGGYWKNEIVGNNFKINSRLADELNRLNTFGIPIVRNNNNNNNIKWLDNFKIIDDVLNHWIFYERSLDDYKVFKFLDRIWQQGFSYYQDR